MKKTIITLLALGGVALGAEQKSETITLTDEAAFFGYDFDLSQDWTMVIETGMFNPGEPTDTSYLGHTSILASDELGVNTYTFSNGLNILIPNANINVGTGGDALSDMGDTFWWNSAAYTNTQITLSYEKATASIDVSIAYFAAGKFGEPEVVVDGITGDPILAIKDGTTLGAMTTGVAGTSVTFTGSVLASGEPSTPAIPEPTTATLSLLALAGLAARRRRK